MKRGAEFSVYQGGSPARRPPQTLPDNLNLRIKQRSLTNLTLLSDGEQRVYSFELDKAAPSLPQAQNSYSPSAPRAGGSLQGSPRKEAIMRGGGMRGTRAQSLSLSLTKVLSQSEHSLIPVPWRCTGTGGRPQRASYSGHPRAESARPSKEEKEADDDRETAAAAGAGAGRAGGKREGMEKDGGYWAEEEVSGGGPREGTAQLDKEVILTMLGDLEQALHAQPRPRKSVTSTNVERGAQTQID